MGKSPAQIAKAKEHALLDVYIRAKYPPDKQQYLLNKKLKDKNKIVTAHKKTEAKRKLNKEKVERRARILENAHRNNSLVKSAVGITGSKTVQTKIALRKEMRGTSITTTPIPTPTPPQVTQPNANDAIEPETEIPEPSSAISATEIPEIITNLDEIRNLFIAPTSKIFNRKNT